MSRPGLISAPRLAQEIASADPPLVVDLRQKPDDGLPVIPGSVWVGLHDAFAMQRPERRLSYDLPEGIEVARALGSVGATPQRRLVFADDMGNRWATRAYWVLHYYRHPAEVRVLDGGIAAHLASGAAVAERFASPSAAEYPPPAATDESIRATADQVLAALGDAATPVCDVRSQQEYTGEVAQSGRGGHIPGAVHVPWDACLAADGTFLPDPALAEVLAPFLERPGQPLTYCQGGIRASLTWFALQVLLGRPARLYAGSWEEWAQDRRFPVEHPG